MLRSRIRMLCRSAAILSSVLLGTGVASAQQATSFPGVWLSPASESTDFLDLFRKPSLWSHALPQIGVFHFTPRELDGKTTLIANNYADIAGVNAFRLLRGWGLQTAVGAPAVKGWDCTGKREITDTLTELANVAKAGGNVDWVTMDEPLATGAAVSGTAGCRLSVDQVAAEVATYVQTISTNQSVRATGTIPRFVDTEAYPATSVAVLEQYITSLKSHGFTPAGVFLDVNVRYLELRTDLGAALPGDLRAIQSFLKARNIAFGVILWSGLDPIDSDQYYYQRTIAWTRTVHQAIGAPDAAVFSSWVHRCDDNQTPGNQTCSKANPGCPPSDKLCGHKTVPINLPDNDPKVFSHTRLVLDALAILRGP